MKSLYIIKAGSTFATEMERLGDFEEWVRRGLGDVACPVAVVNAEGGEALPAPELCAGAVVTGSHAMVTDNLPWSVAIERWIQELIAARVPFLGICYGHQLLGRAVGGEVGYHPRGREVGTVSIELTPEGQRDPLFEGIPARFVAHATHAQSVLRLPEGTVHLAFNGFESYHAFRVGESAWGVQFHPEYTREIMQTYVRDEIADLEAACEDAGALREVVSEAPLAGRVLTNFASVVCRTL
ncbi:glutamine amidotransferase [Chlorobaculum sp. MV4-Y]|uniref:glutamine amidotransferase n=1 Tax=Chlorobaculum sp. MV4-Y TaxID=2976335 RepID=UPI0021AF9087|nr:glutamine amidotransferase [Chlorobaculum sp. MV4-Y]UWX58234.1 glutamine amidotransferase [Chlorobaculum sp. MV4-Y]